MSKKTNENTTGRFGVTDQDGQLKSARWDTAELAREEGLYSKYLLSGDEVVEIDEYGFFEVVEFPKLKTTYQDKVMYAICTDGFGQVWIEDAEGEVVASSHDESDARYRSQTSSPQTVWSQIKSVVNQAMVKDLAEEGS